MKQLISLINSKNAATVIALYPYVLSMTLMFFLLEIGGYPGLTANLIIVPLQVIIWLMVSWQLVLTFSKPSNKREIAYTTLVTLIRLVWLPLVFVFFVLNQREAFNYPNYVFSSFGVHLDSIQKLIYFLLMVIIVDSFGIELKKIGFSKIDKITTIRRLMIYLFSLAFLFLVVEQLIIVVKQINRDTTQIVTNISRNDQEKFIFKYGGNENQGWVMTYAGFIKSHTQKSDHIFIPPQLTPWQMEGNKHFFRWFLYPRWVINGATANDQPQAEVDAILIAHGAWPFGATEFGWPKFNIPKEKIKEIWLIDRQTSNELLLTNTEYIFEPGIEKWGIILLKGNDE